MANKPTPKREVAINRLFPDSRIIQFYATRDAIGDFEQFGEIHAFSSPKNMYHLTVDARYDFDEVVAYVENYG